MALSAQMCSFVATWAAFESGGGGGAYNPFNYTGGSGTDLNSVGVKNYPDYNSGVQATAQFFAQSNMSGVTAAIQNNDVQGAASALDTFYASWGGPSMGTTAASLSYPGSYSPPNLYGTSACQFVADVLSTTADTSGSGSGASSSSGSGSTKTGDSMALASFIATKGPAWFGMQEAYPTDPTTGGEQSWWDWLNPVNLWNAGPGKVVHSIGDGLSEGEKIGAAAIGFLGWFTHPVHLLRILEVIAGAWFMGVGGILFIAILFPGLKRGVTNLTQAAGAAKMFA